MSTAAPATDKKKPRRTRRNFAKELTDLQTYCEASVDVLRKMQNPNNEPISVIDLRIAGTIDAFVAVLKRIGVTV